MARIDEGLKESGPDETKAVIITLKRGAKLSHSDLVKSGKIQPIEGLEGTLKASLTGDELRRLSNLSEVEAIEEDSEQHML